MVWLAGKVLCTVAVTAMSLTLMLALGAAMFGVTLPSTASAWLAFVALSLVGAAMATVLGLALSTFIPNAKSASAIVQPIFLGLFLTSGTVIPLSGNGAWIEAISSVFPLRWLGDGFRRLLLPEVFSTGVPGGAPSPILIAAMILGWLTVGTVVLLKRFPLLSR